MNGTIRTVVVTFIVIALTACASAPKIALRPEVKQSIKRIALVETPEPSRYFMDPGQTPGGSALYMFGAIGGAIIGGVEAKRYESATTKFTEAIAPLKPELTKTMLTILEKGYDLQRVPPPPRTKDGKEYDLSKIEGGFDAILIATLTGGYYVDSDKVSPKVSVSISIYSRSGTDVVFADTYLYCSRKIGRFVQINPDPKYVLKSVDALYEDISIAVEGLRMGAGKVSERAVADL